MKRILTALVAVTLVISATGCSLFGKKESVFDKASKQMIQAATEACDAKEASKKQIKAFKEEEFFPGEFEKGAYYTFAKEELADADTALSYEKIDDDDLKNLTVFCKKQEDSCLIASVFELTDKEMAADTFEAMSTQLESTFDEAYLDEHVAKEGDLEYATKTSSNEVSVIIISQEGGTSLACYLKLEENVITKTQVSGTSQELFSEYYAFMKKADYADQEKLLKKSGKTIHVDTEFDKASKNMIDSATHVCGAQELTEDEKPEWINADLDKMKELLQEGSVYFTYTDEKLTGGSKTKTEHSCFYRNQDDSTILAYVYEVEDEVDAKTVLNTIADTMNGDIESLCNGEMNVTYALKRQETQAAAIVNYTDEGKIKASFVNVQGNVVATANYIGASDSTALKEFYDFMSEAGYEDLKTLLETEGVEYKAIVESPAYTEASNKLIECAKKDFNANEADENQRELIAASAISDTDAFFVGAYWKLRPDQVATFTMGTSTLKSGDVLAATAFVIFEQSNGSLNYVYELQNEDLAIRTYDEIRSYTAEITEDALLTKKKTTPDLKYGIYETETEYVVVIETEAENTAYCMYLSREGNIITCLNYSGMVKEEMLIEFYSFMRDGFYDVEALKESCSIVTGEPGAPGDSLVTGDFATDSEAMVQAAISAYGAQEANEEEIAVFADPRFAPNEYNFVNGSYHVFTGEEAKEVTYGIDVLSEGDIVNSAIFYKGYQQQMAFAFVIECKDEAKAKDLYDFFDESVFTITEEDFEEYADLVQYGFAYDLENEKAAIYQTKDNYEAAGEYLRIDGNQVILTAYMGTAEDSMLTEYYAFMRQVGYMDMEALLWGN